MNNPLKPCIKNIFEDEKIANPLFQVVEIRQLPPREGAKDRYKFAISDGVNYCPAMLNSQLSYLVTDGMIEKFQIIKANNYQISKPKKLIVLFEIEVLPEKYNEVLGNPSSLNLKEDSEEPSKPNHETEQRNLNPQPMQKKPITAPPPPSKQKPSKPNASYLSISSLTSYIPAWTILARVVQKGQMKQWSNARTNGQLFPITLKDKQGDEIKGTFFNEEAEKFYDKIELDKVYIISGGRIKNANKKYSNIAHDYEITFDKTTTFEECSDEQDSIGEISYNFVKLKDLENVNVDTFVDTLTVVTDIKPVEEIHSNKTNKSYSKRTIVLSDDSNASIECTLWEDDAINFPSSSVGQVLRIKDAKVGDFHGKNIGTTRSSILKFLDRSDPEAIELYKWYDENKDNIDSLEKISSGFGGGDFVGQMIYLDQINTNDLGRGDTPDNFCAYVSLKDILQNRNLYYLSCPNPDCKNKGVSLEGDKYICNACKKFIEDPVPRYAFTANFGDFSGSAFFSVLGDEGQNLLGVSADEWKQQTEGTEEAERQKQVKHLLFKDFKLKGRAKKESYNSEERVKLLVTGISEIDFADAAKFYAAEIDKF